MDNSDANKAVKKQQAILQHPMQADPKAAFSLSSELSGEATQPLSSVDSTL